MLKITDGVDGAVKLSLRLQLAADFNNAGDEETDATEDSVSVQEGGVL